MSDLEIYHEQKNVSDIKVQEYLDYILKIQKYSFEILNGDNSNKDEMELLLSKVENFIVSDQEVIDFVVSSTHLVEILLKRKA